MHDFVLWVGVLGTGVRLYHAEDLSHYWTAPSGVSSRPRGVVAGRRDFGRAEGWVLAAPTTIGGGSTTFVVLRHIVIEPPFIANPVSGHIPGLSFEDTTLTAAGFGFDEITTRGIAYDEQNDRLLLVLVDATGGDTAGPRYLVSYSSGKGVVWMVPVGSNDELPTLARFSYGQIWMYGGGAVTVRSAEDGEVLFRQTGFPHVTGVGTVAVRPRQQRALPEQWRQRGRRLPDHRR